MGQVLEVMDANDNQGAEHKTRETPAKEAAENWSSSMFGGGVKRHLGRLSLLACIFLLRWKQSLRLKYLQAELRALGTWRSFISATMEYGIGRVIVGDTHLFRR